MKAIGYVGGVVRAYRAALDWIQAQVEDGEDVGDLVLPSHFTEEIHKLGTRGWTENYFDGPPDESAMMHDQMRIEQPWVPVGIVRQAEPLVIETRKVLEIGDSVEYMGRDLQTVSCTVSGMALENNTDIQRANPGQMVRLRTNPPVEILELHSLFRKNIRK